MHQGHSGCVPLWVRVAEFKGPVRIWPDWCFHKNKSFLKYALFDAVATTCINIINEREQEEDGWVICTDLISGLMILTAPHCMTENCKHALLNYWVELLLLRVFSAILNLFYCRVVWFSVHVFVQLLSIKDKPSSLENSPHVVTVSSQSPSNIPTFPCKWSQRKDYRCAQYCVGLFDWYLGQLMNSQCVSHRDVPSDDTPAPH